MCRKNGKKIHQSQPGACEHVCLKGQKGHKVKQASQTYLPDWERGLTADANISLIFAGLPLNGTDSNNCKHLGSLQALHPDPPGPFTWEEDLRGFLPPHKSRSEREDYLSSPRRDMGTGILSDCFTLIIRTGRQDSENADMYRKCSTKKKKKTHHHSNGKLSQLVPTERKLCSSYPPFPLPVLSLHCSAQHRMTNQISTVQASMLFDKDVSCCSSFLSDIERQRTRAMRVRQIQSDQIARSPEAAH